MARYDDDNFGGIFPRRTGVPTGAANEHKMLDGIGGSEGFRTQQKTNLDGSITMLRTRNGMPEFSRSEVRQRLGGKTLTLRCRMMSDLYPRGADVLLSGGVYATQNAVVSWPDNTTSVGLLSPGKPYKGVRDEVIAWRPPAAPQTWYDNRPDGLRQFDDTLSWAGSSQPRPAGRTNDVLFHAYYEALFGSYTPIGSHVPGNGDERGNLYQEFIGSDTFLYRNAVSTGIQGYILAACAVVSGETTTYRILAGQYVSSGLKPAITIQQYTEAGEFIDSVSVTYPPGLSTTSLTGISSWNRSGTQACLLLTSNNLLLIGSDGSCSVWPFPYTDRQFYSYSHVGVGPEGGVFQDTRTHSERTVYYNLESAGYYGDELLTVIREVDGTLSGVDDTNATTFSVPQIPTGVHWFTTTDIRRVVEITATVDTNRLFVHQTGEVLDSSPPYNITRSEVYIDDGTNSGGPGVGTLNPNADSVSTTDTERHGHILIFADYQQKAFIIKKNKVSSASVVFSIDAVIDGQTVNILPNARSASGFYRSSPSIDLTGSSGAGERIPPLPFYYESAEADYTYDTLHFAAAIDRTGSVVATSILYFAGDFLSGVTPVLSDLKAKTATLFRDGNLWNQFLLPLPVYDGSVKWLSELLISEF